MLKSSKGIRRPVRLQRTVRLSVLLPVLCVALGAALPLTAAVLETPPAQVLEPGQFMQLPLVIREGQGPRIEISLGTAPPGASLVLDDDGQLQLEWQAGRDFSDQALIEIRVRDVDGNEFLDSVFVLIRHPRELLVDTDTDAAPSSSPDTVAPPDIDPAALPENEPGTAVDDSLQAPRFSAVANQVVSAGWVVTLRVAADLPGDAQPVLQVDRLPRQSSFESNQDGSRTFRWETSDTDQGEHLFRFTAFNPRDPELRTSQEVLIVVGDPTKKVTLPEPLPGQ